MTDSEKSKKGINAVYIVIALLVIVILLQAAALMNQGKRQAEKEKRLTEQLAPAPARSLPGTFFARSRTAAPQSAATQAQTAPQNFWGEDPFEEFDAMSRRMSNMMRSAFLMSAPVLQNLQQTIGQGLTSEFSPAIDLEETEKAYIVRGDLPGLEKDHINLTVRNNVLTIEGVRQTSKETGDQNKGFYAQERSYGSFARSLALPGPVDESKISAEYKDGVLTITLPKIAPSKSTQKVPIQ